MHRLGLRVSHEGAWRKNRDRSDVNVNATEESSAASNWALANDFTSASESPRLANAVFCALYRVRQKYLTILQNTCEWNRWRGESVLERSSSEAQSISVAMERWPVEHRAFAVETYLKNNDSVGYFVGTSIFIGTSVPSRNTSSSEDISRARCTKRNQGQRCIWNRTSGKKWQQFLPPCCNVWCRTFRNAWGNVLTRDATSQTLYSGSECCN